MFCPSEPFAQLLGDLEHRGEGRVQVPSAGAKAFLLAALHRLAPGLRLFVVSPEPDTADVLRFDAEALLGGEGRVSVVPFPAWELLPYDTEEADAEVLSARLAFLSGFCRHSGIGISSLAAFLQPVPSPAVVAQNTIRVGRQAGPERDALLEWLGGRGYRRQPTVTVPGEFAIRGGIVDVYPLHGQGHAGLPVRVEFIGDLPGTIRLFEPESQRSTGRVDEVTIGAEPSRREEFEATILEHLDHSDTVLVLDGPNELKAHAQDATSRFPGAVLDYGELVSAWGGRVLRLASGRDGELLAGAWQYVGDPGKCAAFAGGLDVFVEHEAQAGRIADILERHGRDGTAIQFHKGFVSEGFVFLPGKRLVLSDAAIMNTKRLHRGVVKPLQRRRLINLLDLSPGDYVVHVTRGVARYLGIERLEVRGRSEEFLSLLFAERAKVYVPVSQFYLVQPYIGPADAPPDLTRLGTAAWTRKRESAQEEARRVAKQLLAVQARRRSAEGIQFPEDDELQEEFEAAFPYEETPDQLSVASEIKKDMQAPVPMERLLCGDVGFGKTEVAMRAAYKAFCAGFQVLVAAPTTILTDQHFRTFSERFRDEPACIELLSRFRTRKEREEIVREANEGRVDVLIGTHAVLGEQVCLKRPGLVIMDEEHRFGVRQKESLKERYPGADVLMLSATPIPRTLHMALSGLMDISSLRTPPRERLAVRTAVVRKNPDLIRRVVLREIARGGQVYYLHNRVGTIDGEAALLSKVVPEARVLVLHGRMSERRIAEGMRRFLEKKFDVLLATTIIESGIDIPSVNTMLIDRPEQLGLAELHQLRGRVGRYRYRAYCYLMLLPHVSLLGKARRRLKAVEELQHLGAGFDIALRDMEIRGIGELLGLKQWGRARDVGMELYLDMLSRAVKEIRGEKTREALEVSVRIFDRAFIPEAYVPDGATRLDAYRQVARAQDEETLAALEEEFIDRFGALPLEAENLFREKRLAAMMSGAGMTSLGLDEGRLHIRFLKPSYKALQRKWRKLKPDIRFLADGSITVDIPPGGAAFERAGALLKSLL